jgi:hypothetical protein
MALVGAALAACTTRDEARAPTPPTTDATTRVVSASGFGPLREADVRAFAQPLFGDAAELEPAEKAQAHAAANDAVTGPDGTRVTWRSAQHTGYAEAVGLRYEKYIWHCYDAARHATYRDERPCRPADRMVGEADYWRLSAGSIAHAVTIASVAPTPTRQPCRTINEVTAFAGGRLLAMREHCLPLPSGP